MLQEGLELCDGMVTAPELGTGTDPASLSFLFVSLDIAGEGVEELLCPFPSQTRLFHCPLCRYEKLLTWGQCYAQALANIPSFCPPLPRVSPSAHHLLHHGACDIKVGLFGVGDHHVIDVVPLLSPHVA